MIFSFLTIVSGASKFVGNPQTSDVTTFDKDIQVLIGILIGIAIISFTILTIIKYWMEYRLKNRLIDKGLSENIINSILQNNKSRDKNSNIKWFAILAGLGIAFTIINYTLPLGFHSLIIMTFCLSASFLGYFLYLKYTNKQE